MANTCIENDSIAKNFATGRHSIGEATIGCTGKTADFVLLDLHVHK